MTRKEKRLARVTALQVQYAYEISRIEPGILMSHISEEDERLTPEILEITGKLARLAIKHQDSIDNTIKARSVNWDFSRIALIDRLVIRIAIAEMIYIEDVPPKVSISEAVEIAKLFSTEDSSRFVNGILDAIYNDLLKGKVKIE